RAVENVPEALLDLGLLEGQIPGLDLVRFRAPWAAPLAVVELLDSVKREGLPAKGQSDAQDRLHLELRIVLEMAVAPLEHLEEQPPGQLLHAQGKTIVAVVAAVEDEPAQVDGAREVAGEQIVENGRRKRAASKQVHPEPMPRQRPRDVD